MDYFGHARKSTFNVVAPIGTGRWDTCPASKFVAQTQFYSIKSCVADFFMSECKVGEYSPSLCIPKDVKERKF